MKKKIIFLLCFTVFINAASFDCKKVTTKIEEEVCKTKELSRLDEILSYIYKENIQIFTSEGEQIFDNKFALVYDQTAWLEKRDTCLSKDISICLVDLYKTRINELTQYKINYQSNTSTDKLSGQYEYNDSNDEASLNIKKLSKNKYLINGVSLHNITNKYGPNIGIINAIADLKENNLVLKINDYELILSFNKNIIEALDKGLGYDFGMGVSFSGAYIKKVNKITTAKKGEK